VAPWEKRGGRPLRGPVPAVKIGPAKAIISLPGLIRRLENDIASRTVVTDDERNLEYLRPVDHVCDIDAGCGGARGRPGIGKAPIAGINFASRLIGDRGVVDDGAPRGLYGGGERGPNATLILPAV